MEIRQDPRIILAGVVSDLQLKTEFGHPAGGGYDGPGCRVARDWPDDFWTYGEDTGFSFF